RAALGPQPALDDAVGALRPGAGRAVGEGEVHPQAVVSGDVVELGGDPHERLAGPELEGGAHGLHHLAGALPGAVGTRRDGLGQHVLGVHHERAPHRPALVVTDLDACGVVDDDVVLRRAPVVGVARVATVDEPAVPGY